MKHPIVFGQKPPAWRSFCRTCGEWIGLVTIIPKDAVWENGWPDKATQFYAHDRKAKSA